MDARLQQRVQRYGWDLAAPYYEPLWQGPLAIGQRALLDAAALQPGERVLDVACGTGLVSFEAARAVGREGYVLGTDLSGRMVDAAKARAQDEHVHQAAFERMDAQLLSVPSASFDAALCGLGLMYVPDAEQALREMRRALRPGGRASIAVWGERASCGWASVFEIVDAEVSSEVCPMFFRLGMPGALERAFTEAGFTQVASQRIDGAFVHADDDDACDAAFMGGPMALAWSRFDAAGRARARRRYLESIAPYREGAGYRVPGSFVVATAVAPPQVPQNVWYPAVASADAGSA